VTDSGKACASLPVKSPSRGASKPYWISHGRRNCSQTRTVDYGPRRASAHVKMVQLTRLNQETFLLNPDLIEQVEITPTTVITLSNSHKLLVRESAEEVLKRIVEYRRSVKSDLALSQVTDHAESGQ